MLKSFVTITLIQRNTCQLTVQYILLTLTTILRRHQKHVTLVSKIYGLFDGMLEEINCLIKPVHLLKN